MIVQCTDCRRIRVDGLFRLPWPGELDGEIAEVFCPRCARERLAQIQSGKFFRETGGIPAARKAANL